MKGPTLTAPSEERLVADAKRGDRAALDDLFRLHDASLKSWIASRIGARVRGRTEVEDVLHETQLRALESLDRFTWRGEGSLVKWLRTIAEHFIWNLSQRRSIGEVTLTVETSKSGISPSRALRRDERFDRLEDALITLQPDEQEAVRLARLEGLRIRDIAARMQKSESAVKSLVSRSLRKLRASIGDTESFHLPDRPLDLGEACHDD